MNALSGTENNRVRALLQFCELLFCLNRHRNLKVRIFPDRMECPVFPPRLTELFLPCRPHAVGAISKLQTAPFFARRVPSSGRDQPASTFNPGESTGAHA